MSILIVGFDMDLNEIEGKLKDVSQSVYIRSIPIGKPVYEPNSIEEVPLNLDAIVFVYSKFAHCSSQLMLCYANIRDRFTSDNYYYFCLESFKRKDLLDESIIEIDVEKLQSLATK